MQRATMSRMICHSWAQTIIDSLDDSVMVVDVSEGITLEKEEDYFVDEHDHDADDGEHDHDHGDTDDEHHAHSHEGHRRDSD